MVDTSSTRLRQPTGCFCAVTQPLLRIRIRSAGSWALLRPRYLRCSFSPSCSFAYRRTSTTSTTSTLHTIPSTTALRLPSPPSHPHPLSTPPSASTTAAEPASIIATGHKASLGKSSPRVVSADRRCRRTSSTAIDTNTASPTGNIGSV